ncbi:MAG: 1-phosphofructokinase [Clostridia bacterium]|nr:1-phosphofructokinase [Clostridia bacterium]
MIYTVTFNPAIDYIAGVKDLKMNEINRAISEKILAGGKGINVSVVLKNLGFESIALGFIAGFTGKEIQGKVEEFGIKSDFVYIPDKFSRINVKLLLNIDGVISEETAINGDGPKISEDEVNQFMNKIENIKKEDFIVLAGSVSRNMKEDIYEKICIKVKEKGAKIVADATGKLLVNVLKHNPFLIKPNKEELEEIFGKEIKTNEEIVIYAKKLQEMGAENVLISMDKDGAILITQDKKILYSEAPKGKVENSVGSGDSMVAGFLAGFITYKDYEKALKMGIAAGSASAFSKNLATKEEILFQLSKIEKGV